ncbi:MAG TPA: DUF6676 family protein [Mycobacterium sp.]|nr:DUF6676 family protein [Mycobacterium sp.]
MLLEIPSELCATVAAPPATPVGQCLNEVRADVRDDGVSAPKGTDIAGLQRVVADAKHQGIDLKVVVVPANPPIEAPLRDIATEIGHTYPDSTVLVLSPTWAGTYSTHYDRFTLEAGQDVAKAAGGNPVQGAKNFVSQLQTPEFPWTALTIFLVLAVAIGTILTRVMQVRAKKAAGRKPDSPTPDVSAESRV